MRPFTRCFCAVFLASAAMAADPALLNMVPADSGVIIGIDVGRISSTPLGQMIYNQMRAESGGFSDLAGNAEFEFVRQIREILITAPVNNKGNRGIFFVRGDFPPYAVEALASGTTESSYEGVRILTRQQKQPLSIAILEPALLMGGDPQSVRNAIASRARAGAADPVLRAKAREMSAAWDVWMVAGGSPASFAPQRPSQLNTLGSLEKSIQMMTAGLTFGPTLRISVDLTTRTAKDAASIADALRIFIAMAASGKNAQEMRPVLDSLQLRAEANAVKLDFEIPEDRLLAAIKQAGARRTGRRSPSTEVVVQGTDAQDTSITIQSSPRDMGVVTLPAQ